MPEPLDGLSDRIARQLVTEALLSASSNRSPGSATLEDYIEGGGDPAELMGSLVGLCMASVWFCAGKVGGDPNDLWAEFIAILLAASQ